MLITITIMKILIAIALFFCVTLVSAQSSAVEKDKNADKKIEVIQAAKSVEESKDNTLVISVKGVKKIEDLDIENFNKNSFLNLISSKKRKNSIC